MHVRTSLSRWRRGVRPALLVGLVAVLVLAACSFPPNVRLVARGLGGEPPNDRGFPAVISADGNLISFGSDASNLVAGDTNGYRDAFVHDRRTDTTRRINVSSEGEQANSETLKASRISGNGRHAIFISYASNLVEGDTNGSHDVFTHDLRTGVTERVSVGNDGRQANEYDEFRAYRASISDDGNLIAFNARGLDANRPDESFVYLWDRRVHGLVPIPGPPLPAGANVGVLSGNGNVLAYLVPGADYIDTPQAPIFRDLRTGRDDSLLLSRPVVSQYSITMDDRGRMVSWAGRDESGHFEAVLADRRTRTVETMYSTWGAAGVPNISGNGRYLTVLSEPPEVTGSSSISVLDRRRGTTTAVGIGYWTGISDDGRAVVFETIAEEGPFLWLDPRR